MAHVTVAIEGLPGANPFAQDENMHRDFRLPLDDWGILEHDPWAEPDDEAAEAARQAEKLITDDVRVGWHSDRAIYSERDWRKKYIKDVTDDPFSHYALIAFGIGGELTAVGLRSIYLKTLYHAVADYIPGITVESDMIIFGQPFQPLYFYLDAMRQLAQQNPGNETEMAELDSLVKFYEKWLQPSHDRIRAKIQTESIDFNQLWALFKPGELIYSKDEWGNPQIFYACASAYREGGREYGDNDQDEEEAKVKKMTQYITTLNLNQPKRFCFDSWNVRWDLSTRRFTRSLSTFKIVNFKGTRKIGSLPYYPLDMYVKYNPNEADLVTRLQLRGRKWKDLVSGGPVPRKYEGAAIELEPGLIAANIRGERINLKDRVVVDNDGNARMVEQSAGVPSMKELAELMTVSMQLFSHKEPPIKLGDFDERHVDLDDVDAKAEFNDFQALLCPSSLNCFSLTMRKWFAVSVEDLSEIQWNKAAWDHLVLDEDTKHTIKTLVANHRSKRTRDPDEEVMIGDVIERKGSGLVIVLYGPPGVGKTLTAESVAEYTQRPLYAINVGEVTSEERVRARLQQVFTQASKWNAVLLLDEADVVLEKRSFEDIRRNGTVSVFLQMLEYYEGVLFLTTNRLEHIDNAFQSRINLAYEYPKLKEAQRREIWSNFIDGLPESDETAKLELRARLDSLATLDLNGRQIRNILFTARSLVPQSSDKHFSHNHVIQIIEHTQKLKEFFEKGKQAASSQLSQSASRAPVAWNS